MSDKLYNQFILIFFRCSNWIKSRPNDSFDTRIGQIDVCHIFDVICMITVGNSVIHPFDMI